MAKPLTDSELDAMLALVKRKPGKIESMSVDDRRAYDAVKARESRSRKRKQLSAGKVPHDLHHVRRALSDAALMILATGGPGSEQVMSVLERVFSDKPGVPVSTLNKARAGKIKPMLLRLAETSD